MSLYKDASLAMIPSAYKDGKLYSIRPTDGSGDFTFSRGSNLAATRVDVNGLIEKGRENLLLQSNSFNVSANWVNTFSSETGGQAGYDGSSNAWLLTKTDAGGRIHQNITASGILTYSVYLKANASLYALIQLNGSGADKYMYINLTDGSKGSIGGGNIDENIEDVGGGWYRCSVTADTNASRVRIYPANSIGDVSATSGSIYIQDAQLEQGLAASEVITTGASTAQAGILEDMPRLDYSGGASCPSLLLEPSRTNIITQSEYFGAWDSTTYPITISTNAIASPSGFIDAALLTPNSGSNRHAIREIVSCSATTYTLSAFYKKDNAQYVQLSDGGDASWHIVTADLDNGTITNETNATGTIEPYANDWYRITCTFTRTNANTIQAFIGASPTDSNLGLPSFDDTSLTTYAYGIQVEQGSYPTSYIPTYGSSVTRSADYMQVIPTDLLGSDSGTWFMELNDMTFDIAGTQVPTIYLGDSTTNCLAIEPKSAANNKGIFLVKEESNVSTTLYDFTISGKTKFCFVWSGTTLKVFRDGVQRYSATNFNQPANWDSFVFNHGTREAFSEIPSILLFPTALTDSECIALTTL